MSAVDDLGGEGFTSLVAGEEPAEDRRKRAAGLLLLALIALIIWWAITQLRTVPDVLGMPEELAIQAIEDAGFAVGDVTRTSETAYDVGTVANQAPEGGTRRFRGSEISIVIATGGDTGVPDGADSGSTPPESSGVYGDLTLPEPDPADETPDYVPATPDAVGPQMINVLGMTEAEARAAMRDAGFSVTVDYGPTTASAKGRVYYQNPAPDSFVESGIRVSIWVSTGTPYTPNGAWPYPQPPYPSD